MMSSGSLPIEFHRRVPRQTLQVRPVVEDWVCQRSGDCCRQVETVGMTEQEQHAVMAYAQQHLPLRILNKIEFRYAAPGFVELTAGPCPFLEGKADCSVHPVRPYVCRRFGCLRPDVIAEPLVMAPLSSFVKYGTIGCSNLRERLLQSRVARRTYALLQRRGMQWALSHGWKQDDANG